MPRYYFHLSDGRSLRDEEGTELSGPDAATALALTYARDIAASDVREGHLNQSDRINIEGKGGEDIGSVTFREAVDIRP